MVCAGLIVLTWVYFPDHPVVVKSQQYVTYGLLGTVAILLLTIIMKLFLEVLNKHEYPGQGNVGLGEAQVEVMRTAY